MVQQTFTDMEYANRKRTTRRETFLDDMGSIHYMETEIREPPALSDVGYRVAKRPSQNRMTKEYKGTNWDRAIEHAKASVRSKVEHPFLIVKRLFHAGKMWYRGLRKNLLPYYLLLRRRISLCICGREGREFCMTTG